LPICGQESELLQTIVITRHGDRTPTKVFPNTKSDWPEGLGQLTHIGMKEHFELGKKFRKTYIEDLQFVNQTYKVQEVLVKSSPKERTLMSAHSFMMGFYHQTGPEALPGLVQPVPIYSSDRTADNLLYAYKNCPKLRVLNKDVQTSEEWINMTNENAELLQTLSTIFGTKVGLKDVTTVLNLVHGEQIHNKPSLSGITSEMWAKMQDLAVWIFKRKFYTREMGKLGAGLLVQDIRDRMNRTKSVHMTEKRKADQRFILYSAHDGTLLALMSALELTHLDVPHYASQLVFELRYQSAIGYYINIVYNGEHVEYPKCGKNCHIDQFSLLAEPGIPLNWAQECEIETKPFKVELFHFVALSVGFILGAIVTIFVPIRDSKIKAR